MRRERGVTGCALIAAAITMALALPAYATPLRLPPVTRTQLANGLVVLVMPTQRLPLVDFRLIASAGSVYDPQGKEGVASLTSDLLTQGAGKRNARQIAEDIAFIGGDLSFSAGTEQIAATCEVLKKDFPTGLEMLRDCVVSPTFPDSEFQRRKQEALGALAADKDDPSTVADRALLPFLMAGSPLGHAPIGTERSVAALTREDVVAFHRARLTPDHCILAVVGDVDPKAATLAIAKAFAAWKASGEPPSDPVEPLARAANARRVLIIDKPEVTQSQIRLACPAVARNHPDYYAIEIANTILGGGFTSRLVNQIRVVQGLTYGIGSGFGMYRKTGTFRIRTSTRNETLRKCIDGTLAVVRALVDQGPTEAEITKAKRYLTGQFPLGLQAPDDLAAQLVSTEFYGLDPKFIETYSERINAVTAEDVRRVLAAHFCVDDLEILVVSKAAFARTALQGLGPIEVKPIE